MRKLALSDEILMKVDKPASLHNMPLPMFVPGPFYTPKKVADTAEIPKTAPQPQRNCRKNLQKSS